MPLFCHIFPLAMEAVADNTIRREVLMRIVKVYTKEYTYSLPFKTSQKSRVGFFHFFIFPKKECILGFLADKNVFVLLLLTSP